MQSNQSSTLEAVKERTDSAAFGVMLPLLAFAVPFAVSHPQWLTGTLVNCFLLLAAVTCSRRPLAGVIVLPSIGAVANGLLFGTFTTFLLWFLPFIWIGNWIFVTVFEHMRDTVRGAPAMIIGAVLKTALLGATALVLVRLSLVPSIFLTAMSVFQLVTALTGGFLALGILRFTHTHD
jgi:hypothetical protein